MNNKYVKVVYESEPIGKEGIILYLTTFDIDKYNKEVNKVEVAINVPICENEKRNDEFLNIIEARLNDYVKRFYEPYIEETKTYLKFLKTTHTIEPRIYDNVRNVNNVDKITCNNIYGNVNNCEILYCNEIHGKVNNVEKIVYKNKEQK